MILALLHLACRHAAPDGVDTADTGEEPGDSEIPEPAVHYSVESVATGTLPGQQGVALAFVNPLTGVVLALDGARTTFRTLLDTYVHPIGDYCAGGTVDENGICRGGITWTSGRIASTVATLNVCTDAASGALYLLKAGGDKLEVIDLSLEGDDPYSYLRAVSAVKLPIALAQAVNWTGDCAWLPDDDVLLLSSPAQGALAKLTVGDMPSVLRTESLGFAPGKLAVVGDRVLVHDRSGDRLVQLGTAELAALGAWQAPAAILDVAFAERTGDAWVAMGAAGVAQVTFDAEHVATATLTSVAGTVGELVADPVRGIAWGVVESDGFQSVALFQAGNVRATWPIDGTVLRLGEPSATGDVPVFWSAPDSAVVSFTVLAPVEDVQVLDPLRIFLFTTIEEPSDVNMALPCSGDGVTFDDELTLVRNNARVLAGYGIPIAMAITDNFAEKAELCGQTAVYGELADLGFELGAMLHNRPCYHCSAGGAPYNPDLCTPEDPNYIAASSGAACFPDDPEYCDLGDWDCYLAFLAPRVDVADRHIPGGASFIVGGDRHGMWEYDWLRLYRTIDRPTLGLRGFDLSLFAGAWAYNAIDFDDPRGKNPSPWRVEARAAAWHPADIDHWDQDSPTSNLLYLPGVNSATVKLAEQQASGLYMLDFFEVATDIAYRPDDFEMQWQWLRSAVANRKAGSLNTWYFHIHDTGTLNLRDGVDAPVTADPDGDGPEPELAAETMLQDFISRINTRYVATGAVEWALPSDVRALDPVRGE
ncbi:MAG: hypothetical protein EXR71_05705 [Myxococcales bacterium]|nr:hypothetical protein [Myxococcales bacterium]